MAPVSIAGTVDTDALAREFLEKSFDRIYLLDIFRECLYLQQMRRIGSKQHLQGS